MERIYTVDVQVEAYKEEIWSLVVMVTVVKWLGMLTMVHTVMQIVTQK